MGLFDLFRKKEKARVYKVTDDELEDVKLIWKLIKTEFVFLDHIDPSELHIIQAGTVDGLNYPLAGYIVGMYNAHVKYFEKPFNSEALELVVSSLFGDDARKIFAREFVVATLATQGKNVDLGPFSPMFETYSDGQKMGWSEYIAWRSGKTKTVNGLFKLLCK